MKKIELTEYERNDVMRALNSLYHWHVDQALRNKTAHPTIAKRNELEAEKFKELLKKFGE